MNKNLNEIIELKSRKNFMSFYFAIFFSMCLVVGIGLCIINPNISAIAVFLIPIIIGIFGFRLLLWLTFGKEKIYVQDNKLICEKTGTFFIKTKKIELNNILKFNICYTFIEEEQGFEGFKGLVTLFSYKMPIYKIQNVGRIKIILKENKTFRILNVQSVEEGIILIEKLNHIAQLNK